LLLILRNWLQNRHQSEERYWNGGEIISEEIGPKKDAGIWKTEEWVVRSFPDIGLGAGGKSCRNLSLCGKTKPGKATTLD
jgi:hypothetical protein